MLVEDDRMLAKSVMALLRDNKSVEIVHRSDARTAIAKMRADMDGRWFDLILSDYSLGEGDKGDEVLRSAMTLQPKARRVLMSGEPAAEKWAKSGEAHVFYLKDSKLARSLLAEVEALSAEAPVL